MADLPRTEEKLFREWRQSRPGLIRDGVVDAIEYRTAEPTIVFVLKEVNDIHDPAWDLREFLRNGARGKTWNNVTRWTRGVKPGGDEVPWNQAKPVTKKLRADRLRGVAAMNVKKTSGQGPSDMDVVLDIARQDAEFLRRQFALYSADITVCCGLHLNVLPQFAKSKVLTTTNGTPYVEWESGKYAIQHWHPEARFPDRLLYYSLANAAAELRRDAT